MKINANTIKDYLDQLSDDRKSAISTLRKIRRPTFGFNQKSRRPPFR